MNLDRVKARLEATGQSANMASVRAGLGRDYVRDLLRGKVKEPSAGRLRRLAEALSCSVEYLMGSEEEVGNAPVALFAGPMNELPVSYRLRGGFFEDDDGSIPQEVNWPVPALNPLEQHQWLEWVEDNSGSAPVPLNALLHVSRLVSRLHSDDLIITVRSIGDGQLFQRTVRKLRHLGEDTFSLEPPITGKLTALTEEQIFSGENSDGLMMVGKVLAIYQYLDGRVERRMRGMAG